MEKSQITGIVLCGGKGSRIGTNKGIIKLGPYNLIEHVIRSLDAVCGDIIISANSQDLNEYPYKIIQDQFPDIGPISGIYSALSESKTNHNLIVTCDVPFITMDLYTFLLKHSQGYDIVLPEFKGKIQSLTGYFNKQILSFIASEIKKNHNKPIQIFQSLKLNVLDIHKKLDFYTDWLFLNINTRADYNKAQRIYRNISA